MTASPWVTASLYIINDNSRVCTIDVMTRHIVQYMLWIRTRLQRVYTDFITPKLPLPLQAISLPKPKWKNLIKTLEGETSYQIKPKFIWSIKCHQSTPSFGYTPRDHCKPSVYSSIHAKVYYSRPHLFITLWAHRYISNGLHASALLA